MNFDISKQHTQRAETAHTTKWFESPNVTNNLGKEGINSHEGIITKYNFAAELQTKTAQDSIL